MLAKRGESRSFWSPQDHIPNCRLPRISLLHSPLSKLAGALIAVLNFERDGGESAEDKPSADDFVKSFILRARLLYLHLRTKPVRNPDGIGIEVSQHKLLSTCYFGPT